MIGTWTLNEEINQVIFDKLFISMQKKCGPEKGRWGENNQETYGPEKGRRVEHLILELLNDLKFREEARYSYPVYFDNVCMRATHL